MTPAQYWRNTKDWSNLLGKRGIVIASTLVRVSSPELTNFTPYPYVLVDFGESKRECLGTGHEALPVGAHVECVFRKVSVTDSESIISYGIKVQLVR